MAKRLPKKSIRKERSRSRVGSKRERDGSPQEARKGIDGGSNFPEEKSQDFMERFRLGDPRAFDTIVERFEAPLMRFFYRLCWDQGRAEDFTQEVFLRLLRSAHRYEARGRFSTFLYRIATNLWIDDYRSKKPKPRLYSLDASADEEQPLRDSVEAEQSSVLEDMVQEEQKVRMRRALDRLSQGHRLVFELAVYQGLPYPQISELLTIPVGTVKSRMHNAVKALKTLLAEREDVAPRFKAGGA
jgi:RNA polymerase sigma-70 factor (ECF subfamily)